MIILSCKHKATEDYYLVTLASESITQEGYVPSRLTGCYCKSCYLEMLDNPDYEILEQELIKYE